MSEDMAEKVYTDMCWMRQRAINLGMHKTAEALLPLMKVAQQDIERLVDENMHRVRTEGRKAKP